MKLNILILIFFITICSCKKQSQNSKQKLLIENTEFNLLLKQVLEMGDSIEGIQNNLYLKTLAAIQNNDTTIINTLHQNIGIQSYKNSRRQQTMQILNKPKTLLELDTSVKVAFRFEYYRSFINNVVLITAMKTSKGYFVETTIFEGCLFGQKVTKKCTKILKRAKKNISENEWDELTEKVEIAQFWRLKGLKQISGLDGSYWYLEGYYKYSSYKDYNLVSRWSPPAKNDFREIGEYMIELTQIDIGAIF